MEQKKKKEDKNKRQQKGKLKFEVYKNYFEATQLQNKINQLEKNEVDLDNLKRFVKSNKLILKSQQRFRSEKHNAFTENVNNIALSSKDDKRIQSIDVN